MPNFCRIFFSQFRQGCKLFVYFSANILEVVCIILFILNACAQKMLANLVD